VNYLNEIKSRAKRSYHCVFYW